MSWWTTTQPARGLTLHIAAIEGGLCQLGMRMNDASFLAELRRRYPDIEWKRNEGHPLLEDAAGQLKEDFEGRLREFQLPLIMDGTPFQQRAWQALRTIPYGETRSYAQMARQIGAPKAFRAVGAANGQNPIAIIVPCHRVIASNGSLCGFGGGLDFKQMLLELELRVAGRQTKLEFASA